MAAENECRKCGKAADTRCSRCSANEIDVWYCTRECQAADYKAHKQVCRIFHLQIMNGRSWGMVICFPFQSDDVQHVWRFSFLPAQTSIPWLRIHNQEVLNAAGLHSGLVEQTKHTTKE